MQTANDIIINVQEIEPRLRHQTIFDTFDTLQEGESLIIHNNHDPKPVFYQLMDIRGNIFDWEYLQEGPEWWDIKVTRNVPTHLSEGGVLVVNVPDISPQYKHATIFHVFENLNPGESFIIHNDHDPKPLYYQLSSEHGDVFTWEYITQGPEWYDIRVTLKDAPQQAQPEAVETAAAPASANGNEKVVDVPSLEPRLKHPTIFSTFDTLQPGESMIIHNDHDPKPVYYQLLSMRGDVFTWEYLQQGPQWWDIRVTRKGNEITETIGEIVAKDLRKADVLKKYGIDFCCGGKKTVREACAEKGIDATKVEQELQQIVQASSATGALNYEEWNLDFLADYIVNTHHNYVRKYLPEIKGYAAKVARVHGDRHPELLRINELVEKVDKEMFEHMADEENNLFPAVKEIVKAKTNGTPYVRNTERSFSEIVATSEQEHESVGDAMKEIRSLSDNFTVPADGCTSYRLLFKMLEEFENDLFVHIHLENNILFPKAEVIEKSLA